MDDLASLEEEWKIGKKLFRQGQIRDALDIFTNIFPAFSQNMDPQNSVELINMICICYLRLDDFVNFGIFTNQLWDLSNTIEETRWNNLSESDRENERMEADILADDLRYFLIEDYMFELKLSDSALRRIEIVKKIGFYGESLDTYRTLKRVARTDENPSVRLEALNSAELIKNKLI